MKRLTCNSDVCHSFANKEYPSAIFCNMFFEKGYDNCSTLYSYGHHFAIAKFVTSPVTGKEVVLFTESKFSSSTGRQITKAQRALRGNTFVFVPRVLNSISENTSHYTSEANNQLQKLALAKKPSLYIEQLNSIKARADRYYSFLGIDMPVELSELLDLKQAPEEVKLLMLRLRDQGKERRKEIAEENKRRNAEYQANHLERVEKWRKFDLSYVGHSNYDHQYDYLRFNSDSGNVETSQSVNVPVKIALDFYNTLLSLKGADTEDIKLMNLYQVRIVTYEYVIIGCHKILFSEIESIMPVLRAYNLPVSLQA